MPTRNNIPSTRPPRLAAQERRLSIEDAATRLFGERGYAATTVEDIVAAAGVTKPILYRHFDNKKHLHMTLLQKHRDALAAAPIAVFSDDSIPHADRMRLMLEAWFAHVDANPYVLRLLFRDTTGDPEVEAVHQELRAQQRAADVAFLREFAPDMPEDRREPFGEVIRASLTGLALWWQDHPDVPRAVLVETMLSVSLGIVATASRRA